jgi:hypothetical protein
VSLIPLFQWSKILAHSTRWLGKTQTGLPVIAPPEAGGNALACLDPIPSSSAGYGTMLPVVWVDSGGNPRILHDSEIGGTRGAGPG